MSSDLCASTRLALGVYLVGAIHPAERTTVDRHLASCRACREELAGLASLPALMARVGTADANRALGHDPDRYTTGGAAVSARLDRLLRQMTRVRRGRRSVLAAVVIVSIAGTAGVIEALPHPAAPPSAAAAQWTDLARGASPATGAGATIRYQRHAWGTELEVRVTGIKPGTTCQLRVTSNGGGQIGAGGWTVTAAQSVSWYPVSVPAPVSSLRALAITAGPVSLITLPVRVPRAGAATAGRDESW